MTLFATLPLTIPSPENGIWFLGPVPLRAYALCIIAGIVAAVWIGQRRWVARGGKAEEVQDVAVWGIIFGLIGARLYHVATDWQLYFGEDRDPITALYLWRGGLGIWGAVALGAIGIWIGCRRHGIKVLPFLDAIAPGVLVAQAMGRWGNWFNQELYGRPLDAWWALEIDPINWPSGQTFESGTTFHPTFLYESLWNLGAFVLVIWLDRRYRLGAGQVVAAYVMAYTAGRGWIEWVRIDSVQLDDVGGLRFNVWVSIVLFVVAAAYFTFRARQSRGREEEVYLEPKPTDRDDSETGTLSDQSVEHE